MPPVEARYLLNGEEKEKIVAEDGESVALDTPAGIARANLNPRRSGLFGNGTLGERFYTELPGQKPHRDDDTTLFNLGRSKKVNNPELTRSKTYKTIEGDITIELKAINSDPPKKDK